MSQKKSEHIIDYINRKTYKDPKTEFWKYYKEVKGIPWIIVCFIAYLVKMFGAKFLNTLIFLNGAFIQKEIFQLTIKKEKIVQVVKKGE